VEFTRRQFGALAMTALPGAIWSGTPMSAFRQAPSTAKPNSKFGGVQVGAISYCFRQISYNPEDVAKAMAYLGLNDLELEQAFFEPYLGAPRDPTGGGQPAGVGSVPAGGPFGRDVKNPPSAEAGGAPSGGRGRGGRGNTPPTPEAIAALEKTRAELRKWRLALPMQKVEALRNMFADAGVTVSLVKFPQLGGTEMSDEEIDYCFQLAKTMRARGLTCEPPLSQTKRLAKFADKHQMIVSFHNHSNVTSVEAFGRTGAWEQTFFYSPRHWANVDVGHFTAGNGFPPTEFIREYHARITNLHLKDRKINGPNVPWGQGDTPIADILRMVKREKYNITASIELEYPIPQGSSVMDEMANCVKYCKDALA
jgi:sugar phosphate isomerase/epimerase